MNRNTKQSNREEEVSKRRLPDAADPRDGVRLIKAFLEIKEPARREELIRLAEDLAKASSDYLGTTEVEENHKRSAGGDAVDGSQVVDYEFRHEDGVGRRTALGQIQILFAPANSALGSSFETPCPVCAPPHIWSGTPAGPRDNKILRCIIFTFNNGNRDWPRFVS